MSIGGQSDYVTVRGDGTTTVYGNLLVGDTPSDVLTVNGALQGAVPLVFEGRCACALCYCR